MSNSKKEMGYYIFISFFVFIYLALRAFYLPALHDEIATFYFYVQSGKILPPEANWDANNHYLNSILSHVCFRTLGDSLLSIRIPNLISFLLFAYYTFRISGQFSNKIIRISLQYSLVLSLPFLEYFGICRGYGISMALLLGCLYYTLLFLSNKKYIHLILTLIFLQFSLSANLSLLIAAIILSLFLIIRILIDIIEKKKKTALISIWLIIGIVPLLLWIALSMEYKKKGLLYEGYTDSFYFNSYKTIVPVLTGHLNNAIAEIIFAMLMFAALIICIYNFIRNRTLKELFSDANLFPSMLFGCIIASIMMANLLKVNYPSERIGIYWWPLLIMTFFFHISKIPSFEKIQYCILAIPISIGLNALSRVNLNNTSAYTPHGLLEEKFYTQVLNETINNEKKASIGSDISRELVWSWYNYKNNAKLNPCETQFPECNYDYVIADTVKHKEYLNEYQQLLKDTYSNYALFKNRKESKNQLMHIKKNIFSVGPISDEFFTLDEGKCDSLLNKTLCFSYSGEIHSGGYSFPAFLQVTAINEAGETIYYHRIVLNALQCKWEKGEKINHSLLVAQFPKDAVRYNTCIWNFYKKAFEIRKMEVSISEVTRP